MSPASSIKIQNGSCQNNHLIFKSLFSILSIKAGINSQPFAIFTRKNDEQRANEKFLEPHAPNWELCFNVRIAVQRNLPKSEKNSTDMIRTRAINRRG